MKTKQEAINDLRIFAGCLELAREEILRETLPEHPEAEVALAAISKHKGGGKIFYNFRIEDFVSDLKVALDLPEMTKEEILDSKVALMFLRYNLTRGQDE